MVSTAVSCEPSKKLPYASKCAAGLAILSLRQKELLGASNVVEAANGCCRARLCCFPAGPKSLAFCGGLRSLAPCISINGTMVRGARQGSLQFLSASWKQAYSFLRQPFGENLRAPSEELSFVDISAKQMLDAAYGPLFKNFRWGPWSEFGSFLGFSLLCITFVLAIDVVPKLRS